MQAKRGVEEGTGMWGDDDAAACGGWTRPASGSARSMDLRRSRPSGRQIPADPGMLAGRVRQIVRYASEKDGFLPECGA